ncbi:MAG: hypothetical protein HY800_06875, partial [Ignavibacteriales bacterium]|nr:hypothetical protein [Ignavibacteriales bacterium]
LAGTSNVTGGTIQIGDASTPANQTIGIYSTVSIFNLDVNSTNSPTAILQTSPITVLNDLTIGSTLDANNLDASVGGDWLNNGIFTSGSATVSFNGSSNQTISGASATAFNNMVLNNSSGLTITTSPTINGILTLTNGIITTGSNDVYISSSGSVARTSGHVFGNLRKYINSGVTSKDFEIGGVSIYAPVSISFGSVSTAGDLTVSTTEADHSDITNSGIDPSKSVNRYWSLIGNGIVFTNYNAVFNFVSTDLDGSANPNVFIVSRFNDGVWTQPTVGTRTSISTEATGLTGFGDFQIGEQMTSNLKTWDGGAGTTSWGDDLNWNPDGVPTSIHDINLDGAYTVEVNVAAFCNSFTLNNAGLTVTILTSNSLSVSSDLNISNGTLNTEESFPSVSDNVNITGGTVGYTGGGNQIIKIQSYNNFTSGTYNNLLFSNVGQKNINAAVIALGDLTISTGSSVTLAAAQVLQVNGSFTNNGNLDNNGIINIGP